MRRLHLITTVVVAGSLALGASPSAAAGPGDVEAPVVSATGLTDGQVVGVSQRISPVLSDDTGVTKVEVVLNGAVIRTLTAGQWVPSVHLSVPARLHDTDAEVTIRASDAAGNSGEATTRVHVDTRGPQVTLTPPFESFVGGVVTITATDVPDDLAKIVLQDHATGRAVAQATAAPWSLRWDTSGRTGAAWVHFELTDKAGNVTLLYGFYALDNTGPAVAGVDFPQQADRTVVEGRISGRSRLTARVYENSPLSRLEWWVDGTLRATIPAAELGSGPVPFFDWDTGKENRTAVLEVRAYDVIGNRGSLTRTVVIDNAGPAITSIAPADKALVRGETFRTTVRATDPSGIRQAELNSGPVVSKAPFTEDAWAGKDGQRTLTWTLTDRLGNTRTAKRVVTVDNTRPKLKLTKAPGNGAKVKKTVKITVSATDRNGINRVELLINGKVVAKDTKASYTFSVNPKKYPRKFKVQIRAYDRAGNLQKTTTRTWRR